MTTMVGICLHNIMLKMIDAEVMIDSERFTQRSGTA